eukprot:230600_1
MTATTKVLLSKSLMDLRQCLEDEIKSKKMESLAQSVTTALSIQPLQRICELQSVKSKTPEISSPTAYAGLSKDITHYKMPLSFNYHHHKFIFYTNTPQNQLATFHCNLEKHETSITERYGWKPTSKQRVNIDLNASLIGMAINPENSEIMAMITFFDVSDSKTKSCTFEKEMSLCVLPKYQRRHLATDLVRSAWNLFADPHDECWIYVMNSRKSGMFWRKFKQWYPAINFRLVYP